MNYLIKIRLPIVVFLTGACVLIIEIVATRILSPYFGNTIYTVSSIIGIVLAALSLGYYCGGKLADQYPTEKLFYFIILVSGFSVVFLYILTVILLPSLGYKFSIVQGPLISALLLFFIPSFLLGTLSPFAIKLQSQFFPKKGTGSIAGEIFFWSTLGSIAGSLMAGFFLIPRLGISRIILTVAILLICLGFLPLVRIGSLKKKIYKIIFLVIIAILSVGIISFKESNFIYARDGIYEKISIYDSEYNGRPTRFLQQDHSGSGAMFLDSDELVNDYTKYFALYKVFKPETKNVLVIGGGAYSIPKALLEDLPDANVDVTEIEPSLYDLAQKYFKLPSAARLNNYTDDGRRFLYETDKKYDLIFSDVYYSLYSIPVHFTTQEFFALAKEKLSVDGILVVNLIGDLSRQEPSLIMSEIKTFQSIFANSYFFAVDGPQKTGLQNILLVGYNSQKVVNFNEASVINDPNPIIQLSAGKLINMNRFELSEYSVLTDDFSPLEYLTGGIIRKSGQLQKLPDGREMLALIAQQLRYGPRYLSASGHASEQDFIKAELEALAPEVIIQPWQHQTRDGQNQELTNIIGRFNPEKDKRLIIATHYDSKKFADLEDRNSDQPVPGANDSASGVAVLLELARTLANSQQLSETGIDLVFFDGEEGEENIVGDYTNWQPIGSTYFAEHLSDIYGDIKPVTGLVLDMICDHDLRLYKELSSVNEAPTQTETFWNLAQKINKKVFPDQVGLEIKDDHTALNQSGIPSFLLIDPKYPPFHTTHDTLDKCSPESLEIIGKAVIEYINYLDKI